jgi:hypothetical protein
VVTTRPPRIRSIPAVVTVAVATLGLAACGSGDTPTDTPTTAASTSTTAGVVPGQTVPVGRDGFAGRERFCATNPLIGSILYNGTTGAATLDLAVGHLPADRAVEVNWVNDPARAYVVASFATNPNGVADQSSLRFYRPGEQRGIRLVLTTAGESDQRLGSLLPCAE